MNFIILSSEKSIKIPKQVEVNDCSTVQVHLKFSTFLVTKATEEIKGYIYRN